MNKGIWEGRGRREGWEEISEGGTPTDGRYKQLVKWRNGLQATGVWTGNGARGVKTLGDEKVIYWKKPTARRTSKNTKHIKKHSHSQFYGCRLSSAEILQGETLLF